MPKPDPLTLLFDDPALAAIAKPAGLASVPGGGEPTSALRRLAAQLGLPHKGEADPRVRAVHRLDKDTTGVLLFAKTREAQQAVSHQFQNNRVAKSYVALVAGEVSDEQGTVDAPMARDDRDPIRMRVVTRKGKPAVTDWRLVRRFRGYALLEVRPRTGKTHQIRVHLAHVGMPLAVDPLYGRRPAKPRGAEEAEPGLYLSTFKRGYRGSAGEERPLISRLTLHAERLSLLHPNGSPLELVAELPKDLRATINMLSKYAS